MTGRTALSPMVLLGSKLAMPPMPGNVVRRSRLTERLARGSRGALTLLSAPAGYGKTTLLAEWHSVRVRENLNSAYLALDADDNHPPHFMAYLAAALARHAPRLAAPPSIESRPASWQPWLTGLLNQIAALDTPLVLVLDNYQRITSGTVHAVMSFLLEHLPATLHLVIATRKEPPLPIARMRALGKLSEFRAADLAFDEQESSDIVAHTAGLAVSPGEVAQLFALTEGWPAGLQLAALALRDRPAGQVRPALAGARLKPVTGLSGSHPYICDYLVEQVLAQQPESIQTFMRETSNLERLSGPLCDTLTGSAGSARLLSKLERANLFLLPLAGEQGWYRYHPLMAACLRESLAQHSTQSDIRRLHRRASRWYEQHELQDQAIRHALAADAHERAALLIDRAAEPAMARGEVETILGWLQALPEAVVRARPGLCVWYAWSLCLTGRWQAIEPWLHAAEAKLQARLSSADVLADAHARDCRSKLGEIAAVRALAARRQGDLPRSIALSQLARGALRDSDLVVRSAVSQNLAVAYIEAGKYEEGSRALADAEHQSLSAGHAYIYIATLIERARLCVRQRHLPDGLRIYRQAREYAEREGLAALSVRICAELEGVLNAHRVLLDPLSPRELEVLRLIAAGRSTAEIAAELVIAAGTVRNHLKNIYGKLGAHSRFQAVAQALALNVI